ncbi:hypothetical protein VNI00_002966 [Paramarasmius palmivorus]|uniref:Uncharacterized protein n=1 Tax=Paramarasmius palmivorus TaxID=297713 RepID=A0AAW0DZP1_9AGAR
MASRSTRQSNSESQRSIRRSSRLNNRQSVASGTRSSGIRRKREIDHVELPQTKRRKVESKPATSGARACNTESSEVVIPRRSQRITPSRLIKREQELLKKEQVYKQKISELEAKNESLTTKVEESAVLISEMKQREAEAALAQLEEHFTCPLWHESVDCPICRSLLVITPDRTPRLDVTFPFVPNRTAATVCESLIEKLGKTSTGCSLAVKREDSEGGLGSEWNLERGRKRGQTKKESENEDEDEDETDLRLTVWRQGGDLRREWQKKDKEGKREMHNLLKNWTTMQAHDFIAIKQKLGV